MTLHGPRPADAVTVTVDDPAYKPKGGGSSVSVIQGDTLWTNPVPGGTWSGGSFMPNTKNHRGRTHPGIDIYAAAGTAIVSPVAGTVIASGSSGIGGNWVQIKGDDGYIYYFAHMQHETPLSNGQRVGAGTQVGMVGNTGSASSTSPHLHLTVKTLSGEVIDPRPLMNGAVSVAQSDIVSGSANIPTGGELYEVDGTVYVVFEIKGDGVSSSVFFKVETGHGYTGTPKKISATDWESIKAGAADGGSSEAFSDVEAGEDWDEIIERTLMEMGIYGTAAMSDPSVLAVIAEVLARPSMSPDELQQRLQQTDWWQAHTDRERQWDDKSPAQQEQDIIDNAAQLVGIWFTYVGENINLLDYDADGDGMVTRDELKAGNPELYKYAEGIASGQMTQVQVTNTWVKDTAAETAESPWARTLRQEEIAQGQFETDVETSAAQVLDIYRAYGIDISWDEALRLGEDVKMNVTSLAEIEQQVDEWAMAMYPNKPKGMSTRAWAQPYTQTFQSILELPDTDLQDPLLQQALADGMTQGEFIKQLKKDDRWLETKNARDTFNRTMTGLGSKMGFS